MQPYQKESHIERSRAKEDMRKVAVKLAAPFLALAAIGGALGLGASQLDHEPKHEKVGVIAVDKDQTFSDIAEQVAINTPNHETMQEAAENMRELNSLPRYPEVVDGQKLKVPTSADVDKDQPGIQLNEEQTPQPVVPDESGFNPNTPR